MDGCCGILPKNCHVAPFPLRHVVSLIPPGRGILTHYTRTSHIRIRPTFYLLRISHIRIWPTFYLIRMSHSRNSVRPISHFLRISHSCNSIRSTFHLLRIFHIRCLPPDGRGGRLNFPGQTCLDPSVTPIRITFVANDSDSPDSLARQILSIRQIHFRSQ